MSYTKSKSSLGASIERKLFSKDDSIFCSSRITVAWDGCNKEIKGDIKDEDFLIERLIGHSLVLQRSTDSRWTLMVSLLLQFRSSMLQRFENCLKSPLDSRKLKVFVQPGVVMSIVQKEYRWRSDNCSLIEMMQMVAMPPP